jgi:1,4-alpha-glucan branching enzyme
MSNWSGSCWSTRSIPASAVRAEVELDFILRRRRSGKIDSGWNGFQWHNTDDSINCVYSFSRYAKDGEGILGDDEHDPQPLPDYRVGVPACSHYELILDSD